MRVALARSLAYHDRARMFFTLFCYYSNSRLCYSKRINSLLLKIFLLVTKAEEIGATKIKLQYYKF